MSVKLEITTFEGEARASLIYDNGEGLYTIDSCDNASDIEPIKEFVLKILNGLEESAHYPEDDEPHIWGRFSFRNLLTWFYPEEEKEACECFARRKEVKKARKVLEKYEQ